MYKSCDIISVPTLVHAYIQHNIGTEIGNISIYSVLMLIASMHTVVFTIQCYTSCLARIELVIVVTGNFRSYRGRSSAATVKVDSGKCA